MLAFRLLLSALLTASAWLAIGCSCDDEAERVDDAAAPASTSPPRKNPDGTRVVDMLEQLPGCDLLYRGYALDLGTSSAHARRAFTIGPSRDLEYGERGGATFAKVHTKRVSFDYWTTEELDGFSVSARLHGAAARKMTVYVDNVRLGLVRMKPGETRVARLYTEKRKLEPGRHRVTFRFWGRWPATVPAVEMDWVRLGPDEREGEGYAAPTLRGLVTDTVLDGEPKRSLALRPSGAVRCAVEVAPRSKLELSIGYWGAGKGRAAIRLLRDGEDPVVLAQRKVTGGGGATWIPLSLKLDDYVGQLVTLELRAVDGTRGGRVVFGEPALVPSQPDPDERVPEANTVIVIALGGLDRERIPPWGPIGDRAGLGQLVREGPAFSGYRLPSTLSAPVLASALTGLAPGAHRLEDSISELPEAARTVAELAKAAGAHTAMFTGVPTTFRDFGFARGFDEFEQFSPVSDSAAAEPISAARRWLEAELKDSPNKKRLVVVHARGTHPPWDVTKEEQADLPPKEYGGRIAARRGAIILTELRSKGRWGRKQIDEQDWARIRALQDVALGKQDAALVDLLAMLRRKGAWRSTLVFLMGDVPMGAPPDLPFDPAPPLREDHLTAPLLVKFPDGSYGTKDVRTPITSVDIARTIYEALRIAPPERSGGFDLYRIATGHVPLEGRPLLATLGNRYATQWGNHLLLGEWRRTPQLCQRDVDPACLTDVLEERPLAARALWQWTHDRETAARELAARIGERRNATIGVDTRAALTVYGH